MDKEHDTGTLISCPGAASVGTLGCGGGIANSGIFYDKEQPPQNVLNLRGPKLSPLDTMKIFAV